MRSFFKFANSFQPYKFAGTALFTSFLLFDNYRKAFTSNNPPKDVYSKQLGEVLHTKLVDSHFL